ncbi:hypothetical protein HCTV5_20 [Halovirus HCTV-5]|uniref:hypothetical protein n=1 Tax=Halovirus HCTV-5 TaxID=1273748 RepID=UPI00033486F4|nr:hypothetical protein M200_gp020 [Halovirus HCTV-5]AGM11630.1 hypothetical protein HCTV5_20 [Halovirus HCTV-5]
MEDDLIDTLRYAQRSRRKRRTNHYYGKSPIESVLENKSVIQYSRSAQKSRLRGTITDFTFEAGPTTYENPWDAEIWRKWQGRAEEFWDARLQGPLMWEYAKNGSTRSD